MSDFYDPSKLTDDEIDQNITKLLTRASYARYGMKNPILANNIDQMIDALYGEQDMRLKKASAKISKSSIVLETEPDLKVNTSGGDTIDTSGPKLKTNKSDNPFAGGPLIVKKKPIE